MKTFEVSDKMSSVMVVSDKLKAVIDVLVNDLAQADGKATGLEFAYREKMYCNLIYIANDLSCEVVSALETLSEELDKNTPAPSKVTGERRK